MSRGTGPWAALLARGIGRPRGPARSRRGPVAPGRARLGGAGVDRRRFLQGLGGLTVAAPFYEMLAGKQARAATGGARRVIFFYFPDGVAGWSDAGEPSLWHAQGDGGSFEVPPQSEALLPWRDRCVWMNGLSMGGTDNGSHPGGAKKLLTAADHAGGESIDQLLARTVGANMPWRHLYLGAMANADNASGDKHISYFAAGQSITPEDDPRRAFQLLFGSPAGPPGGREVEPDVARASVLDAVIGDLNSLRSKLGTVEAAKLDLHLESLREVERRLDPGQPGDPGGDPPPGDPATCGEPHIDTGGLSDTNLYDPAYFGDVLKAQIDVAVLAMACGLTKVATIQGSHHTSELVMSRMPGTPFHDPGFDMRSHQASHYGPRHDFGHREFADYYAQRQWWVAQFAYLLERLAATPEGDGSMLDYSLCVLCSEVCDGNTHQHDDMPFILAGGAGGCLPGGRVFNTGYRRHGDLWISVARALGQPLDWFGDSSSGPIDGLFT